MLPPIMRKPLLALMPPASAEFAVRLGSPKYDVNFDANVIARARATAEKDNQLEDRSL